MKGRNKEYECFLEDIKLLHEKDKENMLNKIRKLQKENEKIKESMNYHSDSSFISDASKEIGITNLVEQLAVVNAKYNNLKIKHYEEITNLNTK
jgi:predicted translin family RNA/ssDNA-binding protein